MKESRAFNVSQFVRDCWLVGFDEWHMLGWLSKLAPLSNETLSTVRKQFRELDSANTFTQSDRGISK